MINRTLNDDEYKELLKQTEIKQRPEQAKQRMRNYEDSQFMKYGFYLGLFVGAGLLLVLQKLAELLS